MTWNEQDMLYRLTQMREMAEELDQAVRDWEVQNEVMAQGELSMRQQGGTEAEVAVYLHEYIRLMTRQGGEPK